MPLWTHCFLLALGAWRCHGTSDLQLCRPFFQRGLLADQRAKWHKAMLHALRESKLTLAKTKEHHVNVYPYLCLLKDDEYVHIMMQVTPPRSPCGGVEWMREEG